MALLPFESSWEHEILEAARETFNGFITISRPEAPGIYYPATGEYTDGSPGAVLIADRPARAQHIRLPEEKADGDGWQTKRRYRFQYEILPGDPSITKGLVVTYRGGLDPELAKMTFQVVWATNSSHAALRTVETVTEGARG